MKKLFLVALLIVMAMSPVRDAQTSQAPPGMVLIPSGSFIMGNADGQDMEKPVHDVELDAFYMDSHEVTLEEFGEFVDGTNYVTDAEKGDGSIIWTGETWEKTKGINWRFDAAGNLHTEECYENNDCNERTHGDQLPKRITLGHRVNIDAELHSPGRFAPGHHLFTPGLLAVGLFGGFLPQPGVNDLHIEHVGPY